MSVQLKYNRFTPVNTDSLSFKGLNRTLSKHFIKNATEIAPELAGIYSKSRSFIGNLPAEWIAGIPKELRRDKIIQVQDLFAGLAKKLYTPAYTSTKKVDFSVFEKSFKKIIGINIKVSALEQGEIGKPFKIDTADKSYVLKIFHSDISPIHVINHGRIVEPSVAPFTNKNSCGSFVKFYFGKIGNYTNKDSFMVTKYEPPKQTLPPQEKVRRLLNILKSPVTSSDMSINPDTLDHGNSIGLRIIDLGCIQLLPKEVQLQLKKFAKEIHPLCYKRLNKPKENIIKRTIKKLFFNKPSTEVKRILEEKKRAEELLVIQYVKKSTIYRGNVINYTKIMDKLYELVN